MNPILLVCLIGCCCLCVPALIFLTLGIRHRSKIADLYRLPYRDSRFAGSLLTSVFGDRVLRSPYILRNPENLSPVADAILVCSGGVAVITVQQGNGSFSAPEHGPWKVIDEFGIRYTDNLLEKSQIYVSELSNLFVKRSLNCPYIRKFVFLTDDSADADFMSSDSVLPGNWLIEELKKFASKRRLSGSEQKKILDAIRRNHLSIKQQQQSGIPVDPIYPKENDDLVAGIVSDFIADNRSEDVSTSTADPNDQAAPRQTTHSFAAVGNRPPDPTSPDRPSDPED